MFTVKLLDVYIFRYFTVLTIRRDICLFESCLSLAVNNRYELSLISQHLILIAWLPWVTTLKLVLFIFGCATLTLFCCVRI